MKTFEERFTAWVDGRLIGRELAAFEQELESHPEALAEKEFAVDLGNLLRANVSAPALQNGDFFNHQILRQIQPAPAVSVHRRSFGGLWGMVWAGGGLLAVAILLYVTVVPNTRQEVRHSDQYVSNILNARSDDPHITATSFHSNEDNVNVVWLDGLDYLPPDHKLK